MRTILISVLLLTLIGYAPQARAGDKIGAVLYNLRLEHWDGGKPIIVPAAAHRQSASATGR